MPADRYAFRDQQATARTLLAGERRIDRYHFTPGPYCLGVKDAQELRPARVLDALGEMVILDHIGRLQVLVIDHIILAHEGERRLVVKVPPLAAHRLMRFRQQLHGLATACAALLAAAHAPLRSLERAFGAAIPSWGKDTRAI